MTGKGATLSGSLVLPSANWSQYGFKHKLGEVGAGSGPVNDAGT